MTDYMWGEQETQFFYRLDPDMILESVESLGLIPTGRCMALNSMENRVYEVEIESDSANPSDHFVIAKFYRPGRWSAEQILEEHSFLLELKEAEIPVIAPIVFNGKTLFKVRYSDLQFCVFPKQGGRAPHDMDQQLLQILGRYLARMHNVGAAKQANYRLHLTPETFGRKNLDFLLKSNSIPAQYQGAYKSVVEQICDISDPLFQGIQTQRIHGDCHWGNVIHRDDKGTFFIDFDDMIVGPAVQDVWLLVPGDDEFALADRRTMIEAYESMRDFDPRELKLIEPLRSLRMIHFAAWITKRWNDPAFKQAFSFYGTDQYWTNQIRDLTMQLQKIQDSLRISPYVDFDPWS
ncbi:MAG: serine/threonine protein kinase [Bdellovibrionota bacterium]